MSAKLKSATKKHKSKSILDLKPKEAKQFLLKHDSYCNLDLPPYFNFEKLLNTLDKNLDGKTINEIQCSKPRDCENINHWLLNNKDGRFAWRPFQLIHPVIYVSLIDSITLEDNWEHIKNKFNEFSSNPNIKCVSIPRKSLTKDKDKAEQIYHWWHEVEQKSIELSLDYNYLHNTDITDCYGSIYTHTIAWALHTRPIAKTKRDDLDLIGNIIDHRIQDMCCGQTNGLPQGSVLTDFIAEMVLGYADIELSNKLKEQGIDNYQILRYRDDYRIFTNSNFDGEKILKSLSEVLINLNFQMNAGKTESRNDVIQASIKQDKLAWIGTKQYDKNLQKHLLIIHEHSMNFPNGGSLQLAFGEYRKRLSSEKIPLDLIRPLISIVTDIAYHNPRTYYICAAILSKLLNIIGRKEYTEDIVNKILTKFSQIPNTGHMEIWLQRVTFPISNEVKYDEGLCKVVSGEEVQIWNNDWISMRAIKQNMKNCKIIDKKCLMGIETVITSEEVDLYLAKAAERY